jgi:hypothetical protein
MPTPIAIRQRLSGHLENRGSVPTFLTAIDTIHQTPRALVDPNVGVELMSVTMNANFPSTTSRPIPAGAEVV